MTTSHLLGMFAFRGRLFLPVAAISVVVGAVFIGRGLPRIELRAILELTPPHLVSAVSVAPSLPAALIPLLTLAALGVVVCALLVWSFRRSVFGESATRAAGRAAGSVLWFPGRFGGLVRAEQQYFRTLLDVWPGLLLVAAVSVASLFGPLPPIIRQSVMVIVFGLNMNLFMNCFGLNTSAELNRYAILPVRGRDVLLVKNPGLTVIVAAQLALLIVVALWRSGPLEAGAEVLIAAVLLLSHFAWGNPVSVASPFKMHSYHFASSGDPVTALIGVTIGSAPGILVLVLLHSESSSSAVAMAAVLLLSLAVYFVSLHYSGRCFEHRRHIIGERLS